MGEILKEYLLLFLKGIGIGIANIIPGVSGGTIALITGVFEKLVNSIKSFDLKALKLLFSGKVKEFIKYTNFLFLSAVFGGAVFAIYALAFILKPLYQNHTALVLSFFFGLIIASVYFVGKRIKKFNFSTILLFLLGAITAISITTLLEPSSQNASFLYLFLCGIVAVCSMILPGLSGSFVLILMGNYELVMIDAVKNLNLMILIPVFLGAGFGLIAFSHLLSMVFKKFKDQTIGLLTGFIIGSLGIIWPWKHEITKTFAGGKTKVIAYDWFLPQNIDGDFFFSIFLMILGVFCVWILEKLAGE